MSDNISHNIENISITQPIKNEGVRDHSALKAILNTKSTKKGPSYWKLNNSILRDKDYINLINKTIDESIQNKTNLGSHQLMWEMLKINIWKASIKYCKTNPHLKSNKEAEKKIDNLNKKISILENREQLHEAEQNEQNVLM